MKTAFNEEYFENGRKARISGYQGYNWWPERTFPEASTICEKIEFDSVIEYGAGKGFMLFALSLLGKDVKGIDISEYAITNCIPDIKENMYLLDPTDSKKTIEYYSKIFYADLLIAKDVMEHIPEKDILPILRCFYNMCKTFFLVVPFGDNEGQFKIREYEIDKTHITAMNEEWWLKKIKEAGFKIKSFTYEFGNVKDNWKHHKYGNGFFIATK